MSGPIAAPKARLATIGRMPKEETLGALERATVRVASDMNAQNVGNTMWSYAMLGRIPEGETWGALEEAAERNQPNMNPQNIANTLWGYTKLAALRDVELPSCYAAIWDAACGMDPKVFSYSGLLGIFQTHLMYDRLVPSHAKAKVRIYSASNHLISRSMIRAAAFFTRYTVFKGASHYLMNDRLQRCVPGTL